MEECEAGVVFCFVTSEQKGKQRLIVTGLGFWGGLQADSKALGRIRTTRPEVLKAQRAADQAEITAAIVPIEQ